MAVFPWLSEIEDEVRAKIDQKRREPGQPKWDRAEINAAFNAEHRYLYERISSMDKSFNILIDDTITVAAGDQTTALPENVRAIRSLHELKNGKVVRYIDVGEWHEMGGTCSREALYRAYPQSELFWLEPAQSAMTLRVVYSAYPPHLFHGCVQGSGGSILEVESHELMSDDAGVGRNILIYEGEANGQERTVSAYAGSTREITVSLAWTTLPTERSRYTSRPDLPLDAKDAFVYGVCARLVEKLRDARFQEFVMQRNEKLNSMYTALGTLDRRGPLETYDMDAFGHGDPAWDWGY